MSRLTKSLRERMAQCVLNNAFSDKVASAEKVKTDVADKIYFDVYGPHAEAMSVLPDGFLPTSSIMHIAISGQDHCLGLSRSALKSYQFDRYDKARYYVGDEPLAIEYIKAVDACDDLKKQRKSMLVEVEAILNSVHTFKKLWEVWPASKSILEKFESKPTIAMLPAIQFDRVNAALGLPVEVVV